MAFDLSDLLTLGRLEEVVPAPDGTWAVAVLARVAGEEERFRRALWRVDLAGGAPRALTRGRYDDRAPAFRGDGGLAFLSDRPAEPDTAADDPGKDQVWLLPPDHGEPFPLTDEPLGVSAFRVAGERLVVLASVLPGVPEESQREAMKERRKHGPTALHYRDMPVRFWDHWLPEAAPHFVLWEGAARRDLTPEADRAYRTTTWDLSPDGRFLVASRRTEGPDRVPDAALTRIDLDTGAARDLLGGPRISAWNPKVAPGSDRIALHWDRREEGRWHPTRIAVVDADGEGMQVLAEDWDAVEKHLQDWTGDGAALIVAVDEGARRPAYRIDAETGARARVTAGEGTHDGVRAAGSTVVGVRSGLLQPPEVFWGEALPAPFAADTAAALEEALVVSDERVRSTDGTEVQYFVLRPRDAEGPLPGLIWVHGGPIGAWNDVWHWRWCAALFAQQGYALALPNPRGSTGFGEEFVQGIWGNVWGAQCYEDVLAVADALEARPDVDAGRMGLMGGSFGGYMANWIGGRTDRFRCLVTHAGLYDFRAFYGVTDLPAWWNHMLGLSPYDDPAAHDRFSPSRLVGAWRTPTLVVHGEKDYRVPVSEALSLFEALKLHGVDAELLVFPDEGHWIGRPRNIRVWNERILEFLARWLRPM